MKKSISKILDDFDNEQRFFFASSEIWTNTYDSTQKHGKYLYPHVKSYDSILNPIFFFELKSKESLCLFKQVLVRDGLVSTLIFFKENPKPPEAMETILYLHWKLYPLIPDLWLSHCEFFEHYSEKPLNIFDTRQTQNLYLILNESQDFNTLASCREKLTKVYEHFDKQDIFPNVNLIVINKNHLRSKEVSGASTIFFDKLKLVLSIYPDTKFIKWEDIHRHNLNDTYFLNFNDQFIYVSDDFIDYHFLKEGSLPLHFKHQLPNDQSIPLSPFHGISVVSPEELPQNGLPRKELQKKLNESLPLLTTYKRENFIPQSPEDSFLAPADYLDLLKGLCFLK